MLEVTYELTRRVSGPIEEVLNSNASRLPPAIELSEVIDVLNKLAFVVETLAHLQNQEHLLSTTDRARQLAETLSKPLLIVP